MARTSERPTPAPDSSGRRPRGPAAAPRRRTPCRRRVGPLTGLLAAVLVLGTAGVAEAHPGHRPDGSVTAGDGRPFAHRLRVGNDSRYPAAVAHAVRVWSAAGGGVEITMVPSRSADVVFRTRNSCRERTGEYDITKDVIWMNRCQLDGQGDRLRSSVAAHELGHALGLPHRGSPEKNLMGKDQFGQQVSPQTADVRHYRQQWGKSPR